jgi:hypothetical protein
MLRPLYSRLHSTVTRFFTKSKLATPGSINSNLEFSSDYSTIDTFALTNLEGNLLPGVSIDPSESEVLKTIYRLIDEMEVIDDFMNKAQRQGKRKKNNKLRKNFILYDKPRRNRMHLGNSPCS